MTCWWLNFFRLLFIGGCSVFGCWFGSLDNGPFACIGLKTILMYLMRVLFAIKNRFLLTMLSLSAHTCQIHQLGSGPLIAEAFSMRGWKAHWCKLQSAMLGGVFMKCSWLPKWGQTRGWTNGYMTLAMVCKSIAWRLAGGPLGVAPHACFLSHVASKPDPAVQQAVRSINQSILGRISKISLGGLMPGRYVPFGGDYVGAFWDWIIVTMIWLHVYITNLFPHICVCVSFSVILFCFHVLVIESIKHNRLTH